MLAVLAAAVLFGTTGTSQALGPDGTTPLSVGVMRMVIGGTGLAVIAFALAARHARRSPHAAAKTVRSLSLSNGGLRPLGLMVLTGVCISLYQPLFFLGTTRNGVAVGTVVALGSAPILAGLLEWALTRRMPSLTWIGATALATIGVVLLGIGRRGGHRRRHRSARTPRLGGRRSRLRRHRERTAPPARRRLGPVHRRGCDGRQLGGICAFALPFVDLTWLGTPAGVVMALWLGFATISIAYVLFTWGLSGLTAATAATLTLGEPLTASVLGIVVLGERLSALAILGLVVLAAGLALLAWGSRAPRDPAPFAVEA